MADNENSTVEVAKITTPITPLQQTEKINEIIDALAAIQVSTSSEVFGGLIGDSTDDEIGGGYL